MNPDLSQAIWKKSSRSGGNGGNCVEVATNLPPQVLVRDSKDQDGPILKFSTEDWRKFLGTFGS